MLPYRALAEADDEVDGETGYFELRNPGRGQRFLREYFAVRDYARENPRAAERLHEYTEHEVRGFVFSNFPHTLVVVVRDSELVGVAIAYQGREPGYWKDRLKDV
jgi:hypothetical protein